MKTLNGIIIKGVCGLYSVETADGILACKARGIFRKEGVKPLAGDRVTVETDGVSAAITVIAPRKNSLNRPPVANIDKLVIVSGAVSPVPNLQLIDRLTAAAAYKGITPVVVFSKCDLADVSRYVNIYRHAGFVSFGFSAVTGEGLAQFDAVFDGGVCALTGNSGAGKSTLLNRLCPALELETAEVSKKLGRGRHTTRAVELYKVLGGYIADTPGFSSFDFDGGGFIPKYDLPDCFPELAEYKDACKFTGCSHVSEKGCAVLEALQAGKLEPTRHESYKVMYAEAKAVPDWQLKKVAAVFREDKKT